MLFIEYLVKRLTRREVDAVAAHELTHLRYRHPLKLQAGYLGVFLAPAFLVGLLSTSLGLMFALVRPLTAGFPWLSMVQIMRGLRWFEAWGMRDLVTLLAGLGLLLLMSRRFEHTADAGAATLTEDPEASITSLLKLARVNLMPIQWSTTTERWMTHPSMLRRVQAVAAHAELPSGRLEEILGRFTTEVAASGSAAIAFEQGEGYYPVPDVSEKARAIPSTLAQPQSRRNLAVLITLHLLPPAAVIWAVEHFGWQGRARQVALGAGIVVTLGLYALAIRWLDVVGRANIRRRLFAKLVEGTKPEPGQQTFVAGFSPGNVPRFFEAGYNWDAGLLFFCRDGLVFAGDQTRFALARDQVLKVELGAGSPGWWRRPRVYLEWHDPQSGQGGIFSLALLEPCHFWELTGQADTLCERVRAWKKDATGHSPRPAQFAELGSPSVGAVTGRSPGEIGKKLGSHIQFFLFLIVPAGLLLSLLLGLQQIWFVYAVAGLVRVFELVPYWRYRDQPVAAEAGWAQARPSKA